MSGNGDSEDRPRRVPADVFDALERSVRLQSHYAKLLNQYDGGERMTFDSADQWIARLKAVNAVERRMGNVMG